jgi:L-ribulokinase
MMASTGGGEVPYRTIQANHEVYDIQYEEYLRLHDLFGRGGDPIAKRLKHLRLQASAASAGVSAGTLAAGTADAAASAGAQS